MDSHAYQDRSVTVEDSVSGALETGSFRTQHRPDIFKAPLTRVLWSFGLRL